MPAAHPDLFLPGAGYHKLRVRTTLQQHHRRLAVDKRWRKEYDRRQLLRLKSSLHGSIG
jgi:hypothetical protein